MTFIYWFLLKIYELFFRLISETVNALKGPPEEYDRKIKTQKNRRERSQVVEHEV